MSELSSPQNLEEVCAYLELCVEEAKDKAWGEGISFALCFIKKLLPFAQPDIVEKLYQYKCYITDKEGLQHEVIYTGDIRRVTGWEI